MITPIIIDFVSKADEAKDAKNEEAQRAEKRMKEFVDLQVKRCVSTVHACVGT